MNLINFKVNEIYCENNLKAKSNLVLKIAFDIEITRHNDKNLTAVITYKIVDTNDENDDSFVMYITFQGDFICNANDSDENVGIDCFNLLQPLMVNRIIDMAHAMGLANFKLDFVKLSNEKMSDENIEGDVVN